MLKGPQETVRDNKSSSYPVFELPGVDRNKKERNLLDSSFTIQTTKPLNFFPTKISEKISVQKSKKNRKTTRPAIKLCNSQPFQLFQRVKNEALAWNGLVITQLLVMHIILKVEIPLTLPSKKTQKELNSNPYAITKFLYQQHLTVTKYVSSIFELNIWIPSFCNTA